MATRSRNKKWRLTQSHHGTTEDWFSHKAASCFLGCSPQTVFLFWPGRQLNVQTDLLSKCRANYRVLESPREFCWLLFVSTDPLWGFWSPKSDVGWDDLDVPLVLITQELPKIMRFQVSKMRINRHLFKTALVQSHLWGRLDKIWKSIYKHLLKITSLYMCFGLAKMSKKFFP